MNNREVVIVPLSQSFIRFLIITAGHGLFIGHGRDTGQRDRHFRHGIGGNVPGDTGYDRFHSYRIAFSHLFALDCPELNTAPAFKQIIDIDHALTGHDRHRAGCCHGGTAGNTAALRTPSGQFITGEGINIRLTNRRIHIIPEGADRKGKCPRYIPCREADRLLVFVRNGFQHLSVDRFDIITQCSIHAPLHHPAKR